MTDTQIMTALDDERLFRLLKGLSLSERLRQNAGYRDVAWNCIVDPALLEYAADELDRLAHSPAAEPVAWICDGIPDDMIEAGCDAWDRARQEMEDREASAQPEACTDWDDGMIVASIYKAMSAAAPVPPSAGDERFRIMLLELLAVIHGDGGHKTQEMGVDTAHAQAMLLSAERKQKPSGDAELRKALTMAKVLLENVKQTPTNVWWVDSEDPEDDVGETYAAIIDALATPPSVPARQGEVRQRLRQVLHDQSINGNGRIDDKDAAIEAILAALSTEAGSGEDKACTHCSSFYDTGMGATIHENNCPALVSRPTSIYEARYVHGGAPTDCIDYGVISYTTGKEVCRVWERDDAEKIAALLNAAIAEAGKPAGEVIAFERLHPSLEMCVQWSDDGQHIRKWSRIPFDGGECLYSYPDTK